MKNDAFAKCHPAVNFIFFLCAICSAVVLQHPAYLIVGLVSSASYYVLLHGRKGWKYLVGLLPVFLFLSLINPLLNPYGNTILFSLFHRPYTWEALLYGIVISTIFVETILWFGCSHEVLTGDKFTSLFGNWIPTLSLLLVMVLRLIPAFLRKGRQISGSRAAIGKVGGNKSNQLRNGMSVLGGLTSWALEGSVGTADSMRSRGYGSGKRVGFLHYRMTGRDYFFLALLSLLFLLFLLLGERKATFTPELYIAPITGISGIGFLAYAAFLLFPTVLHIKEDISWRISRSKI